MRPSAGQANEATAAALVKKQHQKDLDIQPYPCGGLPYYYLISRSTHSKGPFDFISISVWKRSVCFILVESRFSIQS